MLVKVKAAEGARIRQPNRNSRVMPPEGDIVDTNDTYYGRLLASGDLVEVKDEPKTASKAAAKPEAE